MKDLRMELEAFGCMAWIGHMHACIEWALTE